MSERNLVGPLKLDKEVVRKKVPQEMGNYIFVDKNNYARYVGRSDSDIQTEIIQEMDTDRANGCTDFYYSIAKSVRDAYETECTDYHKYGGKAKLNNSNHPDEPAEHKYPCPVPGCNHPE